MKKIYKKATIYFLAFALVFTSLAFSNKEKVSAFTFYLGDYYYIESAINSNMVLDVSGGSKKDGANIQLYKKNGTDAQLFRIARNGNGYYTFINKGSNKAIDVYGAYTYCGANVGQWSQNSSSAQQWKLYTAPGYPDTGYVQIMNRCGKYLDVNGAKSANGTNIQIWDKNNTIAQVFKLVPYVQYEYWTATINTNSMDEWSQSVRNLERRICDSNHANGIIISASVVSWKTVTWKIPKGLIYQGPGISGYVSVKYKVPEKIRYKVHTHQFNKGFGNSWFYRDQKIVLVETCNCGYRRETLEWEIPLPDPSEFKSPNVTPVMIIQRLPQI